MCRNDGCNMIQNYTTLEQHDTHSCAFRMILCTICDTEVIVTELDQHRRICNEYVTDVMCSRCKTVVKSTLVN